jgi:hypothetical protein
MQKLLPFLLSMLALNSSYATIHYHYVLDRLTDDPIYDIDLDGDDDFQFTKYNSSTYYVECLKATSYFAAEETTYYPKGYQEGAGMGTFNWHYSTQGTLISSSSGNFTANSDKYLMVKFKSGGFTYYGWVRLFYQTGEMYVHSYAYSDVNNETISPGQQSATGIEETDPTLFSVLRLNNYQVAFNNCTQFDKVSIYTLEGKQVAAIDNPQAYQNYPVRSTGGNLLYIAYFKEEKLMYSAKYFVQ